MSRIGLHLTGGQSPAQFLRAQFQGQFSSIFISMIWRQELNAQLVRFLTILNWEVLLTLSSDCEVCAHSVRCCEVPRPLLCSMLKQPHPHRASLPPLSPSGLSSCLRDPKWDVVPRGGLVGAGQNGSRLCHLARGERREKTCQSEPSTAFDAPWEEAGEPRGLASSAGVWGEPAGLFPAAPQGATTQRTLWLYVPGDVCPGQGDLKGPWEEAVKALVTGVKHRCQAENKR